MVQCTSERRAAAFHWNTEPELGSFWLGGPSWGSALPGWAELRCGLAEAAIAGRRLQLQTALTIHARSLQMIGYVTLGTNDIGRAAAFYDALLGTLGAKRFMDYEGFIAWTVSPTQPAISVIKPYDGQPATVGNGVMVAIVVDSKAKVDMVYNKAIELGAKDEGPAGPRSDNFYAGYFRDLDGNKLNVFCMS